MSSENRNPIAVAGGVLLLALWGGLGLFFGKGKGTGNQNQSTPPSQVRPQERPPTQPQDIRTTPQNQLVKTQLQDQKSVQTPPSTERPLPTTPKTTAKPTSWEQEKYAFTYVLRLTHIHPVLSDGSLSKQTITLDELLERGKKAHSAKQELHLRVRGDARARWESSIKQKLREQGLTFSVTNEF